MKLSVYNRDGAEAGRSVDLDDAVFGIEPNDHVIWLDVRAAQAHARQGTHKTKGRSEVSGSTRKLYRQKGTGNARVGDIKSPTRRGGGTIFGPRPHAYSVGVNKKTKQLARRSALAYKLQDDAFRIVEDFSFDAPKTRDMAAFLGNHDLADSKVLFLTANHDETLYRSGRNLRKLTVRLATEASTLDLLGARVVLIQEGAIDALTETLRSSRKPTVADASETEAAEA